MKNGERNVLKLWQALIGFGRELSRKPENRQIGPLKFQLKESRHTKVELGKH